MKDKYDYWLKIYDGLVTSGKFENNLELAMEFLSTYSRSMKIGKLKGYHLGTLGRFFKGAWNTHHGNAIQSVLNDITAAHDAFNSTDASQDSPSDIRTEPSVSDLLHTVDQKLNGKSLDPEGSLAAVMSILREKMHVPVLVFKRTSNRE